MSVLFNEYKPSEQLKPFVEFFWTGIFNTGASAFFEQRVIPNGYVELIIHLSDFHCELLQGKDYSPSPNFTIIGLFTKPYDVHFRKKVNVFGIRFKPEGVYNIFGIPAAEIGSDFADIKNITGRRFIEFTEQLKEAKTVADRIILAEKYLSQNLNRNRINLYYLNLAAEIIRHKKGMLSIEELSAAVFISTRQLEREFKQKLGISPKFYMRIARLNEVNRRIQKGYRFILSDLAYSSGYTDQAHFIKDFKYFTGESPSIFVREKDRFIINPNRADMDFVSRADL
jgi:AraC-like DNA-binding protein